MPGVWEQESTQRYYRCEKKQTTTNRIYGCFYSVDSKRKKELMRGKRSIEKKSQYRPGGIMTTHRRTQSAPQHSELIPSLEKMHVTNNGIHMALPNDTSYYDKPQIEYEPRRGSTSPIEEYPLASHELVRDQGWDKRKFGWVRPLAMPSALPSSHTFGITTRPTCHRVPLLSWEKTPPPTPMLTQKTPPPTPAQFQTKTPSQLAATPIKRSNTSVGYLTKPESHKQNMAVAVQHEIEENRPTSTFAYQAPQINNPRPHTGDGKKIVGFYSNHAILERATTVSYQLRSPSPQDPVLEERLRVARLPIIDKQQMNGNHTHDDDTYLQEVFSKTY